MQENNIVRLCVRLFFEYAESFEISVSTAGSEDGLVGWLAIYSTGACLPVARNRDCPHVEWRRTSVSYWQGLLLALGVNRQTGQRWRLSSANFPCGVTSLMRVAHAQSGSLCEQISLLHTLGRHIDSDRGSNCQLLFCFKKRRSSIYYRYILKDGNKLQLWVTAVFFYSVITIIIFHGSKHWLFRWAVWETLKFKQQD